jgi:hypothetical protein
MSKNLLNYITEKITTKIIKKKYKFIIIILDLIKNIDIKHKIFSLLFDGLHDLASKK